MFVQRLFGVLMYDEMFRQLPQGPFLIVHLSCASRGALIVMTPSLWFRYGRRARPRFENGLHHGRQWDSKKHAPESP